MRTRNKGQLGVVSVAGLLGVWCALPPQAAGGQLALLDAEESLMEGRYSEAEQAFTGFLEDGPNVEAACGLARCYLETGRYEEAGEALAGVAGVGERSNRWHRASADVLAVVGRYVEAVDHLRRALELDSDDHRARLALGGLLEKLGKREEAIETYKPFAELLSSNRPVDAPGLTAAAGGYLRYSALTRNPQLAEHTSFVLNELYQHAYQRLDRSYWPARLAAADLLRSKSKYAEAVEDYLAALRINENLCAAHVGLGRGALDRWDFEETERRIEAALERNPRSAAAFRLQAALKLTERRYDRAAEAAKRALEINPHDVEGLGYAAAACYARNDPSGAEEFLQRARRVTPRPAAFHRVVGDTLSALRQYEASEAAYLLAIQADPTDAHARTELGMMYMQWGEERKAEETLTAAFALDGFDAGTFNTLELLSGLNRFTRMETRNFVIKFQDPREGVLAEYLADYLEGIHTELCEDYGWRLSQKTIIELFPDHRAFGVRITGKPWIHTVGACTGKVIAMEAPRKNPKSHGPYNTARVLRHEYTHTVTLAATGNRVPHWFTEGLAVLQEDAPRPWAWCRILVDAIRRDELFTLESIDWGFIRPRRPNDRQMAYAQSEWMCGFIIDQFGYPAINRMLTGYRDRKSQPEVLTEVLGLTPEAFDARFREWSRADAAGWGLDLTPLDDPDDWRKRAASSPDDADVQARLARAELDTGHIERAVIAAQDAMGIDDANIEGLAVFGEALWLLREENDDAETRVLIDSQLIPAMRRLSGLDQTKWIAPKVLSTAATEGGDFDEAIVQLTKVSRLLPLDPAGPRALAGIHLVRGRFDEALPHLLNLAQTEEDDAEIAETLADIYTRMDRSADARYWLTQAIYIDPYSVQSHEALAAICEESADAPCAARAYKALCALQPATAKHFERAARALLRTGDVESARKFAARAIAIDPDSPVGDIVEP